MPHHLKVLLRRTLCTKHYFEAGKSSDYANNCDYKPNFYIFSPNILVKLLCKTPWLAYKIITYTKICLKLFWL